jgi:hypothetical protein
MFAVTFFTSTVLVVCYFVDLVSVVALPYMLIFISLPFLLTLYVSFHSTDAKAIQETENSLKYAGQIADLPLEIREVIHRELGKVFYSGDKKRLTDIQEALDRHAERIRKERELAERERLKPLLTFPETIPEDR